jgi:hypothetical protein
MPGAALQAGTSSICTVEVFELQKELQQLADIPILLTR